MMEVLLDKGQRKALEQMHKGCILCGGVGTGKSRTALAFYFSNFGSGSEHHKSLYIITTARKRDTKDWEQECEPFGITELIVDSWNNIAKYKESKGAFFIFDEQRVVGSGKWAKTFVKIARQNEWILLSATPGDTWMDYWAVFVANGFFENLTDFKRQHVIYAQYSKFPKIERYMNVRELERLRDSILVDIEFKRSTERHHCTINVDYDQRAYRSLMKTRWNPYEHAPMQNAAELCSCLRRCVNSDPSRVCALQLIHKKHPKLIVFYSFDYELDILRSIDYGSNVQIAEWNGHNHELIPTGDNWVYLVNYSAGAEGWNCIETDTIVFYSQHYSYKIVEQACGRIDRRNTAYKDLNYYHFKSSAKIDLAISRALQNKKEFNERKFITKW